LFGDWKSPLPYQRILNPFKPVEPVNRNIEAPDKQNSMFFAATRLKMSDEDPDYPAAMFGNYMLGGSGAARLWKRIRDKEGLSYSVGTQFIVPTRDDGSALVGYAISAPQNTPKVEASFRDELARALKDGFTADEVAAAKKAWLDSRKVQRAEDPSLVRTLANLEFFGRTMQWDAAIESQVEALTAEQVSAAFRRHVDPASLSFFKAGDFKKAGVFQN
jgi:zinc protease